MLRETSSSLICFFLLGLAVHVNADCLSTCSSVLPIQLCQSVCACNGSIDCIVSLCTTSICPDSHSAYPLSAADGKTACASTCICLGGLGNERTNTASSVDACFNLGAQYFCNKVSVSGMSSTNGVCASAVSCDIRRGLSEDPALDIPQSCLINSCSNACQTQSGYRTCIPDCVCGYTNYFALETCSPTPSPSPAPARCTTECNNRGLDSNKTGICIGSCGCVANGGSSDVCLQNACSENCRANGDYDKDCIYRCTCTMNGGNSSYCDLYACKRGCEGPEALCSANCDCLAEGKSQSACIGVACQTFCPTLNLKSPTSNACVDLCVCAVSGDVKANQCVDPACGKVCNNNLSCLQSCRCGFTGLVDNISGCGSSSSSGSSSTPVRSSPSPPPQACYTKCQGLPNSAATQFCVDVCSCEARSGNGSTPQCVLDSCYTQCVNFGATKDEADVCAYNCQCNYLDLADSEAGCEDYTCNAQCEDSDGAGQILCNSFCHCTFRDNTTSNGCYYEACDDLCRSIIDVLGNAYTNEACQDLCLCATTSDSKPEECVPNACGNVCSVFAPDSAGYAKCQDLCSCGFKPILDDDPCTPSPSPGPLPAVCESSCASYAAGIPREVCYDSCRCQVASGSRATCDDSACANVCGDDVTCYLVCVCVAAGGPQSSCATQSCNKLCDRVADNDVDKQLCVSQCECEVDGGDESDCMTSACEEVCTTLDLPQASSAEVCPTVCLCSQKEDDGSGCIVSSCSKYCDESSDPACFSDCVCGFSKVDSDLAETCAGESEKCTDKCDRLTGDEKQLCKYVCGQCGTISNSTAEQSCVGTACQLACSVGGGGGDVNLCSTLCSCQYNNQTKEQCLNSACGQRCGSDAGAQVCKDQCVCQGLGGNQTYCTQSSCKSFCDGLVAQGATSNDFKFACPRVCECASSGPNTNVLNCVTNACSSYCRTLSNPSASCNRTCECQFSAYDQNLRTICLGGSVSPSPKPPSPSPSASVPYCTSMCLQAGITGPDFAVCRQICECQLGGGSYQQCVNSFCASNCQGSTSVDCKYCAQLVTCRGQSNSVDTCRDSICRNVECTYATGDMIDICYSACRCAFDTNDAAACGTQTCQNYCNEANFHNALFPASDACQTGCTCALNLRNPQQCVDTRCSAYCPAGGSNSAKCSQDCKCSYSELVPSLLFACSPTPSPTRSVSRSTSRAPTPSRSFSSSRTPSRSMSLTATRSASRSPSKTPISCRADCEAQGFSGTDLDLCIDTCNCVNQGGSRKNCQVTACTNQCSSLGFTGRALERCPSVCTCVISGKRLDDCITATCKAGCNSFVDYFYSKVCNLNCECDYRGKGQNSASCSSASCSTFCGLKGLGLSTDGARACNDVCLNCVIAGTADNLACVRNECDDLCGNDGCTNACACSYRSLIASVQPACTPTPSRTPSRSRSLSRTRSASVSPTRSRRP